MTGYTRRQWLLTGAVKGAAVGPALGAGWGVAAAAWPGPALAGRASDDGFDLLLRNARLLDPSQPLRGRLDIGIRQGRIAALGADLAPGRARRVMDAGGRLVTAAPVDLLAHPVAGRQVMSAAAAPSGAALSRGIDGLRPGDILTDCCARTAGRDGTGAAIVQGGQLLPAAQAAWQRGVLFDLGRSAAFDLAVAEAALRHGCPPHTLSSHGPALPGVLSRLMALGLPLAQAVAMATTAPARLAGRGPLAGTLQVGAPADLLLFEWVEGGVSFVDAQDNRRRSHGLLRTAGAMTSDTGVL